jgi:hypothetical protein
LKAQQFGHFLFAATSETGFLDLQIAKFLVVLAADFHFGEDGNNGPPPKANSKYSLKRQRSWTNRLPGRS